MTPLQSALLVAHVLCAVFGFGALFATGAYAGAARRASEPSPAVRRYFGPGRNLAAIALGLVPLFGVGLLAAQHWRDVGRPFPWVGLAMWLGATGLAVTVLWPSEKRLRSLLSPGEAPRSGALEPLGRRCEKAAGACAVLFVVALVFMVVQPG